MTSDSTKSKPLLRGKVSVALAPAHRLGVGVVLSILVVASLVSLNFNQFNMILLGMYLLIMVLSAWELSTAVIRQPISVDLIHWFFVFVFFGLAPAVLYITGRFRFQPSDQTLIVSNIIVLIWIVGFRLSYMWTWPRVEEYIKDRDTPPLSAVRASASSIAFLVLLSAVPALVLILLFGPMTFATRGGFRAALSSTLGLDTVGLLVLRVARPIALLGPVTGVVYYNSVCKSRNVLAISILALIPGIVVNSPTSSARLWAFAVIFGVFVMLGWNRLGNGNAQLLTIVAGLFASQLFEAFRFARSLAGARVSVQSLTSYLTEGHFDAYENIAYTMWFVDSEGHTLGRQLLGGVLFWIPRRFWPNKPVATGQVVYEWLAQEGYTVYNANVAVPLPGEAYIDFGIFGVVILAIAHGFAIGAIDARLSLTPNIQDNLPEDYLDTGKAFYAFGIGIFLVHFRGSFLSTFSILVLYAASAIFLMITLRTISHIIE